MNWKTWMLAAALSAVSVAHAQTASTPAAAAASDYTAGEVRKIDKAGGKITLKHGEIRSLDMPAMTMVFTARDRALLDRVKPGDKVQFRAANEKGVLYVTELKPAQ